MKPSFNRQYCFPNTIILIFQLLGVFIAILASKKLTRSELFLADLLSNWHSKPFTSINSFEQDCPVKDNYDHFKLNSYYLNCDTDQNFIQKDLRDSSYLLDKSNFPICGKKLGTFNYLDFLNITYTKEHSTCEKNCGIIDSLNNILCVKKNEVCPLNKFDIINKTENKLNSNDQNVIEMSEGYYFKISNDGEHKKIILALDIVEGIIYIYICFKRKIYSMSPANVEQGRIFY
jgi:hypothetical protein